MHRHRRIKLGRFDEAKVCLKCRKVWLNTEEFHKSRLAALCGAAVGKPSPVFNDEEMALLRSLEAEEATRLLATDPRIMQRRR